ncbi:hypothetical protein [Flavobacterium sp.]|uniref:hypothetical protein n=1 Tax=Flavobacterium sp. TaxID=239 RepID=UPI0039E3469E
MLKKAILLLLLCGCSVQAQQTQPTASVEKALFAVEVGLVGFWAHAEMKMASHWALRTEIGAETFTVTYHDHETETLLAPVVSVEPKWYYNLDKRLKMGKKTQGNSGNAFSVKVNYNPHFILAGDDFVPKPNHIAILPKWSLRRQYGKHFTLETGIGIGPIFYLGDDNLYKHAETFFDGMFRIGYTF